VTGEWSINNEVEMKWKEDAMPRGEKSLTVNRLSD
jgi:hypothetical protein